MSHAGDLQFRRDGRATGRNGRTGIDVIVCPVGPTQGAAA